MNGLKNLEALHSSIRAKVEDYCGRMISALGPRLRGFAVYGSATGADFIPGRSNINTIAVLDKLDSGALRAILGVVKGGRRKGFVPPLLVSAEYVKASADVFPMEYCEIKDTEVVVYGEDIFSSLDVSHDNLRLECESQLRAAALRTRQAYLEIGLARRGTERILHASVTSLVPAFKAILRLKGEEIPARKVDVATAAGRALGVDTSIFVSVLRDKSGDEKIEGKDCHAILGEFVDAIEAVAARL